MDVSSLLLWSEEQDGDLDQLSAAPRHIWRSLLCVALAKGQILQAMQILHAHPFKSLLDQDQRADWLWLALQLGLYRRDHHQQRLLLRQLAYCLPSSDWRLQHGLCQLSRQRGDQHRAALLERFCIATLSQMPPHLSHELVHWLIESRQFDQAEEAIGQIPFRNSCDSLLLQIKLCLARDQLDAAEQRLLAQISRFGHRIDFAEQLVDLLFELQRGDLCLPVLKQLMPLHIGCSSLLQERYAQAKLLQRQPAEALRTKLIERVLKRSGVTVSKPGAIAVSYDFLGRTDWLAYLHPFLAAQPHCYPDFHVNWLMHVSSRAMPIYRQLVENLHGYFCFHLQQLVPPFDWESYVKRGIDSGKPLRIGWICGDIANHPVCRFLYSWLVRLPDISEPHHHFVVSTHRPDQRYADLFSDLPGVEFVDYSCFKTIPQHVEAIRALKLDIAVDLNGWTGNNVAPAFIARLAPVQLNYLAFHATSGIREMDAWLVDDEIIPGDPSLQEWHVESIVRLPRPFLAWQPPASLPEGRVDVPAFAGDSTSSIRFGCFNHTRKISNQALRVWAQLMGRLHDAQLVLKAFASEDQDTAELLRRRLIRAGIDLSRVIWLPYTATPEDHLLQYAQVDVALDSFPNTGCTTTCEALWMGVPVITLAGTHYVSRMASAVLAASRLREWITTSPDAYIQLAMEQARSDRLQWLRMHRCHWRLQLQASPLGDAADLMNHLHRTFEELVHRCAQVPH